MRYLFALALLAGCCPTKPDDPPKPIYVTRTVKDCSWLPHLTAAVGDTVETKREVIAYEKARQENCPTK